MKFSKQTAPWRSLLLMAGATVLLAVPLPAAAWDLSAGVNVLTHYSKNAVLAGPALEYRVDFPLGGGNSIGLSRLTMDYFGRMNGFKLSWERVLFDLPLDDKNISAYSAHVGVDCGIFWGEPVIAVKDGFLDELPAAFHEVGIVLRPLCFAFGPLLLSTLDTRIAIDPVTPAGKPSLSTSLFILGWRH